MSLIPAVIAEALSKKLGKLPIAALELVVELVEGALTSDDPERYIKRRIVADGAHAAAQAGVDVILEKTTPSK